MRRDGSGGWMWAEALHALAQVDHAHRQLFRPGPESSNQPTWEPPVDVLETDREILILAALPGVDSDEVKLAIEDGGLMIEGRRAPLQELQTAVIHRLELPQGRFRRYVPLPAGRYDGVRQLMKNGCLLVVLHKA